MQFVKEFSDIPTAALRAFLDECAQPFQPSLLYEVADDRLLVDESRRLSSFRAISDPRLFALAAEAVAAASQADTLNEYSLVRNDVTHVKYAVGGFFAAHEDYLSVTSNVVEEYTMLICVTPSCQAAATVGGETRITLPHVKVTGPTGTVVSKATTTPGSALLFRKDLQHEALLVTAGGKEIVSLNVWCTRKSCKQVLVVTFPGEAAAVAAAAQSAPLQTLANARSYALSAEAIRAFPTCMFNGKLQFMHAMAERLSAVSTTIPKAVATEIVEFECQDCSFEEFAVVFRVISGMYVHPADLVAGVALLDFFGIPADAVLVDIANSANASSTIPVSDAVGVVHHLGLSEEPVSCADVDQGDKLADANIIITTEPERALVLAEAAKALGLPYVRFDVLFAEGTVIYGGEMVGTPPAQLLMQPVFATLGDYDNLLGLRVLIHRGSQQRAPLHSHPLNVKAGDEATKAHEVMATPGKIVNFSLYESMACSPEGVWTLPYDDCPESIVWTGLKFAPVKGQPPVLGAFTPADVTALLMPSESRDEVPLSMVLPGGDDNASTNGFFHVDSTGHTCFSAAEAEKTSQFIVESEFLAQLQMRVSTSTFHLPQRKEHKEAHFCNESVYGQMNLLRLTGVVRLDGSATKGAAARGAAASATVDAAVLASSADATAFAQTVSEMRQQVDEEF